MVTELPKTIQTRAAYMNCDQADDLTKDYTILSPNTICADYLTDEGIIECYASSELMIANYAVSM